MAKSIYISQFCLPPYTIPLFPLLKFLSPFFFRMPTAYIILCGINVCILPEAICCVCWNCVVYMYMYVCRLSLLQLLLWASYNYLPNIMLLVMYCMCILARARSYCQQCTCNIVRNNILLEANCCCLHACCPYVVLLDLCYVCMPTLIATIVNMGQLKAFLMIDYLLLFTNL